MGVVGDEYHYILQCPFFNLNREQYLDNYYYINPNIEKFCNLLQTKNVNVLRKLAKLITAITRTFR